MLRLYCLIGASMFVKGRNIEGVIFDIDGTLVDSFPVYCSAFNRAIQKYKLEPVSSEFLMRSMKSGDSLIDIFRKIFPPGAEESFLEKCREEVLTLFLKAEIDEVKPFPGIRELFQDLKERGICVGIATGRTSPPEKEWERFKSYGLDGLIDSIATSRGMERRKPAPDVIIECARRLNVSAEHCLAVGDTDSDIVASRSAGAIAVAICTGLDDVELLQRENPEFLFESLIAFHFFLKECFGGIPAGLRPLPTPK